MQVIVRLALKSVFLAFFALVLFPSSIFAQTSSFRSATTVTTDGATAYTNLSNCSVTDGATCDHPTASGFANLYFRNFGDFAIPSGSVINKVRIKFTGKSTFGVFIGVSAGTTYSSNCQLPSDLWTVFGGGSIIVQNFTTALTNGSLSNCLSLSRVQSNNFIWRINYSSGQNWSSNIDNFEIAFDYELQPSPTPTPTFTPTPTLTPTPTPEPFLDLPWDYQSQGKSFEDVVFNPGSWFDHEYPLQNVSCCVQTVLPYYGLVKTDFYRSHSGYDYNSLNGVVLNTSVLAAAPGWATFKPESQSGGAGNIIKIDHENGYQSWYEHLANDELVISTSAGRVSVNRGQKIGKVGMTGRTTGPHIHLSVFKDSNGNGTFDDDYPWGFTDPLGWEGDSPDPWTLWESGGRNGTSSYNLFIARASPKTEEIPPTGGSIGLEDIIIDILTGTFDNLVTITVEHGPFESASDTIKSVMPSLFLDAVDSLGQKVTQFLQPATITYDYVDADLLNINEDSLKIYWFNDELNLWEALPSMVDTTNKKVSVQTTHFSQFSLMGEIKDAIAPTTEVIISGEKGQDNWYRSDVTIALQGYDNEGGVGLLYTLYTLNGSDWFEYTDPIVFSSEGAHTMTYQSIDKADNKEERKSLSFSIDKTPPEAEIYYSLSTKDIQFDGKDGSESASVTKSNVGGNEKIIVTDKAGNTLTMLAKTFTSNLLSWISIVSIQYNNATPSIPDKNNFLTTPFYKPKTNQLTSVGEVYSVKDKNLLGIVYTVATDKTKIYTYDRLNRQVFKEELVGMHLLKLTTENGTLKYSY